MEALTKEEMVVENICAICDSEIQNPESHLFNLNKQDALLCDKHFSAFRDAKEMGELDNIDFELLDLILARRQKMLRNMVFNIPWKEPIQID